MSGRRNHSCRDSVTVQHAPLISLFALSLPPGLLPRPASRVPPPRCVAPSPPLLAFPPRTRECGKEDRREYYRDCDIRGDSSSRDLRDSQPRSRRLRATSLRRERGTAGRIRNGRRRSGGERREGGARENRAWRGRASGEVTRPTKQGVGCIDWPYFDDRIEVEIDE